MSDQLVVILSESPKGASIKLIEDIGNIAMKLSELGMKQFYIDRGKSAGEFNDLGDSTFTIAENVIAQVHANHDEEEFA